MSAPMLVRVKFQHRFSRLKSLILTSNMSTKVDVLRKTDDQSGLSLRAQRKNRAHQHLAKKHKVDKYIKQDKDKIETEYYFENGLRKVYPYYFGFSSFVKGRWVGRTLEDVYMKEFKGNSKKCLIDQIERGRITVNGKKVPPGFKLRNGQFVEHIVHRHENPVVGGPLEIIDNTPDLVVVNKPASIPVHPCSRYRYNSITSILRVEHGLKNLRTLYRLDRLTSGVLILPKTLKKSQRWEKQLENRQLYKEYVCRVEGEFPEGTLTCDEPIDILSQDIFLFKVGPKGRPSTTTFTRLSYNGKSSVVKCVPLTGRSHQIRVHLQYLGYPILNDPIYNRAVYGKNKGKGGEVEASIEEIAADIRSGTNVGRWKGGENPRYAKFMAQKQNAKTDVNTTNPETCDNGADDVSASDRVGGDSVATKHTEGSDISDSQTDVEMKDKATEEHTQTSNTSTNLLGVVTETVWDDNCTDKSSVCCDTNTSDSNQGSQGSICDAQSNESQLKSDNSVTNSEEIPCKRRKTEQDASNTSSLSSQIKDSATDQTNSVQEQRSSMKCDNTSSTQNIQTVAECSGDQDEQSDIHTSSDVKVDPVRSESPSIIPYENQQYDESKMTYEENCDECMYIYKDPTPADLVLYLHAVRYKGPDWDYSVPLPDWADPNWNQEES